MVASDRISAFDVIMGQAIPGKGALLTKMALFWFDKLGPKGLNICPIHLTGDAPESVVTPEEAVSYTHLDVYKRQAKALCKQRYLEFGCEGQAAKIKGDSLSVVASKYARGELAQVVQ